MNRVERMLAVLKPDVCTGAVPAAFFIHFDEQFRYGQAAIERHLEFFEYTDMDIVKVQYEDRFPFCPDIESAKDWSKLPIYGLDFYSNQLEILAGIIKATDQRALVIQTMYSPFMQACTSVGRDRLRQHIMHDASAVCEGMARITESMRAFVQACIALGVDGFYASTQGGDESMFADSPLFERCIKPYDLELMREMDRQCRFNILHICDYWSGYRNLDAFVDYPGHVVSKPHHVQNGESPIDDHLFHRPLMGGLDRHGVIATGPVSEIENEVRAVIERAPRQFILGADCTLPSDVSWDHIRRAIDTAHTA